MTAVRDRMSGDAAIGWSHVDAAAAAGDYVLCGWRVRSALPLPEVVPWTGDDRPPDITVRLGPAPPLNEPVTSGGGRVQIGQNGACRLEVEDVASFVVSAGRDVAVELSVRRDAAEVREWFLGVVLGMLCHQRGLFPLHASCVRIGGGAVAFAGRTGTGKSTLAAALARRGHGLIADDVSAIEPAASGPPQARPSFPRLRLWDEAMRALDLSPEGVPRASRGKPKYQFCEPGWFDPSPAALRAVYLLERVVVEEPIERVSGAHAATALYREIYRPWMALRLGRKSELLAQALRIASQVPVFRCPVRPQLEAIGTAAARVEAHVLSLRAGGGTAA
jgi:hypothetical protein